MADFSDTLKKFKDYMAGATLSDSDKQALQPMLDLIQAFNDNGTINTATALQAINASTDASDQAWQTVAQGWAKTGQSAQAIAQGVENLNKTMQFEAQKFASTMGLDQNKFQEAVREWDSSDAEKKAEFAASMDLDVNKLNESIRQFDNTQQHQVAQFAATHGLDVDKANEAIRQFDITNKADQAKFAATLAQNAAQSVLNAPHGAADAFTYGSHLKSLFANDTGAVGNLLRQAIAGQTGTSAQQLSGTPVLSNTEYAQNMNNLALGQPTSAGFQGFVGRLAGGATSGNVDSLQHQIFGDYTNGAPIQNQYKAPSLTAGTPATSTYAPGTTAPANYTFAPTPTWVDANPMPAPANNFQIPASGQRQNVSQLLGKLNGNGTITTKSGQVIEAPAQYSGVQPGYQEGGYTYNGGDAGDQGSWTPNPGTPGYQEGGSTFNGGDAGQESSWTPTPQPAPPSGEPSFRKGGVYHPMPQFINRQPQQDMQLAPQQGPMQPPPGFKDGGVMNALNGIRKIPKTGLALLHEGEMVIPAHLAKQLMALMGKHGEPTSPRSFSEGGMVGPDGSSPSDEGIMHTSGSQYTYDQPTDTSTMDGGVAPYSGVMQTGGSQYTYTPSQQAVGPWTNYASAQPLATTAYQMPTFPTGFQTSGQQYGRLDPSLQQMYLNAQEEYGGQAPQDFLHQMMMGSPTYSASPAGMLG